MCIYSDAPMEATLKTTKKDSSIFFWDFSPKNAAFRENCSRRVGAPMNIFKIETVVVVVVVAHPASFYST